MKCAHALTPLAHTQKRQTVFFFKLYYRYRYFVCLFISGVTFLRATNTMFWKLYRMLCRLSMLFIDIGYVYEYIAIRIDGDDKGRRLGGSATMTTAREIWEETLISMMIGCEHWTLNSKRRSEQCEEMGPRAASVRIKVFVACKWGAIFNIIELWDGRSGVVIQCRTDVSKIGELQNEHSSRNA